MKDKRKTIPAWLAHWLFLTLAMVPVLQAQTFTSIYSFANGNDGFYPSGLVQGAGGNLYGTTAYGHSDNTYNQYGTAFEITTGGVLTPLYGFEFTGYTPLAPLLLAANGNFYGTTSTGFYNGGYNYFGGTLFEMTPTGTLEFLGTFTGTNGLHPGSALVQSSGGTIYGTASGDYGEGCVFRYAPGSVDAVVPFSKATGSGPNGLLQGKDGNFYGTAQADGANGYGTVFKWTPPATLQALASFDYDDGANPFAGLIQGTDGNFYGTTEAGGQNLLGTVFKITPAGKLTTLASFSGANGANPYGGLLQATDGNFYGTTYNGGTSNLGTVFELTPAGNLTTLVSFTGANGARPASSMIQATDGNLYGTTEQGGLLVNDTIGPGTFGYGTVFQIELPPATYTLGLSASPTAGGVVGGSGSFVGGSSQTVTATANNSYVFANWMQNGVVASSSADFEFTLKGDTSLVADFILAQTPKVTITSPKANQQVKGTSFTLTGTASDNVSLTEVYYSLNGSGWVPASSTDNWAHWAANVALQPGANTVAAMAVSAGNTDGNAKSIPFGCLVYAPLTVTVNGGGKVSPADNGILLQIGKSYSLKATPDKGYEFVNWTGSVTSTKATLNFVMASNLIFTANFQAKR